MNNNYVSAVANPVIAPQTAGTVTLSLVAISNDGCRDSIWKDVTIYADPIVDFTFQDQCLGELTLFTDGSQLPPESISSNYWDYDSKTSNTKNLSYQFPGTGDYPVKLRVVTTDGCSDSITKTVSIHPLPELDLSLADYEGCNPFRVNSINNSSIESGSISTYNWSWGTGDNSSGSNPSYTYNQVGTFTIKVNAVSDQGCKDSMTLGTSVIVHESPIADFSYTPDEINAIVTEVTFLDESTVDVTGWTWTIDGSDFNGDEIKYSFEDSGVYAVQLIVVNGNSCADTVGEKCAC